MTDINENAPGGAPTPTEGLNLATVQGRKFVSTVTPPADVPVPEGAQPDQWIGGQRDVYAQIGYVAVSQDLLACPAVTLVAEQHADGRLGAIDVVLDVDMGAAHAGLSVAQARELAALLVEAADQADKWTGQAPSPADRLTTLRADLQSAFMELRTAPGNTGDYLLAALDAVADAIEVVRR